MTNLPVTHRGPAVSYDQNKIAKLTGNEDEAYQMPLGHFEGLVHNVRRALVVCTVDQGINDPSTDQVFGANRKLITISLKACLADLKGFGGTQAPLPVTGGDTVKIWKHLVALFAEPAKYECDGYQPVKLLAPVGASPKSLNQPKK